MESFGHVLTNLDNARSKFLQKAAQEPEDFEALQAAGKSYRDAIVELRTKISSLEQELGPDEAHRLVGMRMMYYAVPFGQRVLAAELLGDLTYDFRVHATPTIRSDRIVVQK